jgi:hypothetical protein
MTSQKVFEKPEEFKSKLEHTLKCSSIAKRTDQKSRATVPSNTPLTICLYNMLIIKNQQNFKAVA